VVHSPLCSETTGPHGRRGAWKHLPSRCHRKSLVSCHHPPCPTTRPTTRLRSEQHSVGRENETDVVSGITCIIQQTSTGSVNRVLIYRDGIEGVNASARPSTTQRAKEGWITGSGGAHPPQARQVMNNSRVAPCFRRLCVFGRPHAPRNRIQTGWGPGKPARSLA